MADLNDAPVQFTLTDIDVGSRLAEALMQHVRSADGEPIAYDDLLTLARGMYPKDATLGREVPVGIGAKLSFVQAFCQANARPDLTSLVVNKLTLQQWPGCTGDVVAERRAVAGFEWSDADARLVAYANKARAAVPKRLKPRKERPADVAWYAYFCSHRAECAQIIGNDKQEIINLLMAGLDPETALRRVLAAKAELGALS